ncbi:hypothetical protein RUM44_009178 [Polyplax serrata]|uniref:TNF receptor-associated factor 6 n=1 Tax=Polyplax serrata TaxID=468196 RepID=A0ABR1ATN5_POLSC
MQESNVPMELAGLDPQYECPICLSCLKEPLLTSCGHRFCSSCLGIWLESKGERCPVDGAVLNKKSDLFPDHFTRREILSRKTTCRTCKQEMGISELEEHMLVHVEGGRDGDDGLCPFKSVGCEAEVTKETLREHLTKDIHAHLNLVASSHASLKEKLKVSDRMTEVLAQESALWDPQEKGKEQQNASLMRALYERVVILEQRCHEQNAQIQKLKSEVQEAESKVREVSLQHASGQYLWSITEFSKKVEAMRSGDKRLFFSEGFYTSPIGYKICGRINLSPNNGDQLSLLIHLMKTAHDCTLDWPFTGRIHLAVIHPTNPELSAKETMMTRPDLDSFKRPLREMNTKAFGYPQFISLNDIFKNGFLTNDTLLVKIHIQRV